MLWNSGKESCIAIELLKLSLFSSGDHQQCKVIFRRDEYPGEGSAENIGIPVANQIRVIGNKDNKFFRSRSQSPGLELTASLKMAARTERQGPDTSLDQSRAWTDQWDQADLISEGLELLQRLNLKRTNRQALRPS